MRYILSSKSLNYLSKFIVPVKDKYGNLDSESFYNSELGQEFVNINPFVINYVKDKKELIRNLSMDIAWISLCYNCPLYVYIMTDKWFYKNISFKFYKYSNFGKSAELNSLDIGSDRISELKLNDDLRYFKGDLELIEDRISSLVSNEINLRESPLCSYMLTLNNSFDNLDVRR